MAFLIISLLNLAIGFFAGRIVSRFRDKKRCFNTNYNALTRMTMIILLAHCQVESVREAFRTPF